MAAKGSNCNVTNRVMALLLPIMAPNGVSDVWISGHHEELWFMGLVHWREFR